MLDKMKITAFSNRDIGAFLKLAALEHWISDARELEFLLSEFPDGCFCAVSENGATAGYVTSLLHEQSGWIGNLIVAEAFRGRGLGEALFKKALEALRTAAQTVWLTASPEGKSLYEKYGFKKVDGIIRWVGTGRLRDSQFEQKDGSGILNESAKDIDYLTWGDRRNVLLSNTVARGNLLHEKSGFIVIQPCGGATQFGPFSAPDSDTAVRLLDMALRTVRIGSKVYLDAPASNRAAIRMFNRSRFIIAGKSELMYLGKRPEYRPELLYGLATMGSCG